MPNIYNGEIERFAGQVMENCHRSDARFAGSFSLCGLLLRLRDLCKWEKGLAPWIEIEPSSVLQWIEEREELWERIVGREMSNLNWRGAEYDPFDSDSINLALAETGLHYSAGYAAFLKPSFCLGRVLKRKHLGEFSVVYIGDQLARDLYSSPAQTREREIVARLRPLAAYLWDSIMHSGENKQKALELALSVHGISRMEIKSGAETWVAKFNKLLAAEIEAFVRHEYAEASDQVFPRAIWRKIISEYPHTRVELMARTIKDVLADTSDAGRLKYIIDQQSLSSLAVFTALIDGLPVHLFPEIEPAFERFQHENDWDIIEQARLTCNTRVASMAGSMINLAGESNGRAEWMTDKVEKLFYEPLGV